VKFPLISADIDMMVKINVYPIKFSFLNRERMNIVGLVYQGRNISRTAPTVFFADRLNADKNNGFCGIMAERCASDSLRAVNIDFTNAFGESDGNIHDTTVTGRVEDIEDTIKYFQGEKMMDPGCDIGIVGCGVGTVVALKLASASKYSSRIKAVVGIDAAFSLNSIFNDLVFGSMQKDVRIEERSGDIVFGNGRLDRNFMDDYYGNIRSLCETLKNSAFPTLLDLPEDNIQSYLGEDPLFMRFGSALKNFQMMKTRKTETLMKNCLQFLDRKLPKPC
jgi:hypothetical protein